MVQSDVMTSLIGWLMSSPSLEWKTLPAKTQFMVCATYFLLDTKKNGNNEDNIYSFITTSLERLLQQLSHTTKRVNVEYKAKVRGQVIWPATYKARYSQDLDPTIYTCREVRHHYDTPENQLLKYLVDEIMLCTKAVPNVIRMGFCYFPASEQCRPLPITLKLQKIETLLRNCQHNIHLRHVTSVREISPFHLQRAENSRMEEYVTVVNMYRRFRATVESTSWDEITEIGKRALLLPQQVDKTSELWLQLAASILRT
jgi:hypothetical protein